MVQYYTGSTIGGTPVFIDFKELKEKVSLQDVVRMLDLNVSGDGDQVRGVCPLCGGDSRTLVITFGKGWYCQSAKIGGDQLSLVAHVKRLSVKESGKYLADRLEEQDAPTNSEDEPPKASKGFDAEKYASQLDNTDDALRTFGVHPDLAKAVGHMGVAKKGINRGKLVFPLRDDFGCIIDFIGVEHVSVPKRWRSS